MSHMPLWRRSAGGPWRHIHSPNGTGHVSEVGTRLRAGLRLPTRAPGRGLRPRRMRLSRAAVRFRTGVDCISRSGGSAGEARHLQARRADILGSNRRISDRPNRGGAPRGRRHRNKRGALAMRLPSFWSYSLLAAAGRGDARSAPPTASSTPVPREMAGDAETRKPPHTGRDRRALGARGVMGLAVSSQRLGSAMGRAGLVQLEIRRQQRVAISMATLPAHRAGRRSFFRAHIDQCRGGNIPGLWSIR